MMTTETRLSRELSSREGVAPRRRLSDRAGALIARLRDEPGRPGIDGTAYDTAWLASIPRPDSPRRPRFPYALEWLVDQQRPDGSWGGDLRYEHDRVLCTLAALTPLARYGRRQTDVERLAAGTRYLWQHGRRLQEEPIELVGFELLLPALVERARDAGLSLPPGLDHYRIRIDDKLRLLPPDALYSAGSTVAHSLEFLGDRADPARLARSVGGNGAVGNSPAATAYYFMKTGDPIAIPYLNACVASGPAAPVLYPCETFELLWSAYHLFLAGVPAHALFSENQRRALHAALAAGGVSLSQTFPIPDADDTAVALILLYRADARVDAEVLRSFATREGAFATFPYERHPSVGVNAHVLHALLQVPGYPERDATIDLLLAYLDETQIARAYWLDKWHISPYYATAHVLTALADCPSDRRARCADSVGLALEWVRQTQNADGSWGYYDRPTLEETAYGVLALTRRWNHGGEPGDRRRVTRALAYLREAARLEDADAAPPLWIDKCLYTPRLVVRAVVDSAWIAAAAFLRERAK